jgi:hypothetical protein
MTQTPLRAVTLQTVANYRELAEHAVGAYRASGHRLLALMSRNLERSTRRITPRLAAALRRTGSTVGDVAAKGIDGISDRTAHVIDLGSAGVSAQIGRVADLVEGIENRYLATGLQTAARFSLTGAQAALALSEKLATGADRIAAAVSGKPLRRSQAMARAKTAVRAARRATAPAQRRQAAQPVLPAKATRRAAPKRRQPAAKA